jgi:AsmA protein
MRWFGWAFAAIATLLVAAVLGAPFLVSGEAVRAALRMEIAHLTGIEPHVNGETNVRVFPAPEVRLHDVTFSTAGTAVMRADEITGQLRVLPFLFGRIEISQVTLVRPVVDASAWTSPAEAPRGPGEDVAAAMARTYLARRSETLSLISDLRVVDGRLDLGAGASDITASDMTGIDMSFAVPAAARHVAATGSFVWRGERVEISASVSDLPKLLTGEPSGAKLRLTGAPLRLAFDGTLTTRGGRQLDGTLSVSSPALRRAIVWAGQAAPSAGFEAFSLSAKVQASPQALALTSVHVDLDGNRGDGTLNVALDRERPFVRGTLASEKLDLSPYLASVRVFQDGTRDWNARPMDLATLALADVDLRLSAGEVTVGGLRLGRTAGGANLKDGRLSVTIGEALAFGGTIKGNLGIARGTAGAESRAQLQFADVDLNAALDDLFGFGRIEGKGTIQLALEATGATMQAQAAALNGTMRITAGPGALAGFNVEQLLRRLERRPLSGAGELRTGRTPFERMVASFRLVNGTALTDELRLDGPAVRLDIGGVASVPSRSMDMRGTAALVRPPAQTAAQAASFELPFVLQGSWDNPTILPDAESLIRRSGAAAPLLDPARDGSTRDAVRSAIDQLTRPPLITPPAAAPAQ